jgi:hypothetical protein
MTVKNEMIEIADDERPMKHYDIPLPLDDAEYLKEQGYKIATIVRKIVSDYVVYHRVKKENPIKELPCDEE